MISDEIPASVGPASVPADSAAVLISLFDSADGCTPSPSEPFSSFTVEDELFSSAGLAPACPADEPLLLVPPPEVPA